MMDKQTLTFLYAKYKARALSNAERAEFNRMIRDPKNQELLNEVLDADWDAITAEDLVDVSPEKAEAIFRTVVGQRVKMQRLWPRIAAAASVILVLGAGAFFALRPKPVAEDSALLFKNDIAPGHNQATLTLSDGRKVVLRKGLNGEIAKQEGADISAGGGVVNYKAEGEGKVVYNTLATARGEQSPYPLVLSDGTRVWLNAESSLTFPASFAGLRERVVKVTGEAYFEVSHDAGHPFKVESASQVIEDIGTGFDVRAYGDEPAAQTTLVEGVVKVNGTVLKPGEQLDGSVVRSVNTELVTAWKANLFKYRDQDIESIMRDLSRWYDIEVVYAGPVTKDKFNCRISRGRNISAVLRTLERTKGVHFKIEGRRVTLIE